jgi:tetratricopeptide (TPR) repeat protein
VIDTVAELMQKKEYEAAIPELRKAIGLNPSEAAVHNNLGIALLRTGHTSEAALECQKATELSPDYMEAYANLGVALARLGRPAEAIPPLEKALAATPDNAEVHSNLGLSLAMVGRIDEGIAHLEKALAMHQDFEGEFNLARVLAAKGKFPEAIPHFEAAVKLSEGRDAASLDFLGGAYAEVGRVKEALETAQRALSVAEERHDGAMAATLKTRIEYYQSKMK